MSDIKLLEISCALVGLAALAYWQLRYFIEADREAGKKEAKRLQEVEDATKAHSG